MKGIHAALQGRLGQDVELRKSANGKDWCRLSVGVGEDDELTWVSVSVFEEKAAAVAGLKKGVEVYVEGRLSEHLDRQGRSAAHGVGGHGVGGDASRSDRAQAAKARVTVTAARNAVQRRDSFLRL